MADPVREKILQQVRTTVLSVTTAGSYETDIQRVHRTFRMPQEADEIPYACVMFNSEDKEVATPLEHYRNVMRVSIWVFTSFDIADDEEADAKLNRAVADIEKALLAEDLLKGGQTGAAIPTPDFLIDWLHLLGSERRLMAHTESFVDGAEISVEIQYLHSATDPYDGRGD